MSSPPTISKQRTRWFKIFAIMLPFLFLLLLELGLRWVGYGQDFPLFVRSDNLSGYWVMNPEVSEKYFTQTTDATVGFQEPFPAEKSANTFRIFVLGASTAVGYPYLHNGSFHRWLQYRLNHTFPDKTIEIINLALTAVNSYTVLDFTKQLVDYQPDAVLLYAGHNEYYGALGVGSTTAIGSNPMLVRLMLQLREWRLVQLFTSVMGIFKPSLSKSYEVENLMKRMSAEQQIPYQSELYDRGIRQYEANMTDALEFLDGHRIPTFISTLVSNEKDLPPLVSDTLQEELSASHYYRLGQEYYQQEDFTSAKSYFVKAKELDMLRFRAPEALNHTIRELAERFANVHLVDAQTHFEAKVPHGIIGSEVMLEHVHPNLLGYSLLADAFYDQLQKEKMIDPDWRLASDWKSACQEMPITEVDSIKGAYEIMMLREGWPFYEPITDIDSTNRTLPEAIAGALAVRQITWEEAMGRLYQHHYQNQDYERALQVAEAVTLEHPHQAQYFTKAAGLALQLNHTGRADYLFKRALPIEGSPSLARKIAVNLIKVDALEKSLYYLKYSLAHEPTDRHSIQLTEAIKVILTINREKETLKGDTDRMIQLAKSYLILGKQDAAVIHLQNVLALKPTDARALSILAKIQ